ncbi:hypothetical protein DAEQUDRAFT_756189 [Daedalea quercina L-15889]|uniref:Uncharacterized protein n=1 Tax=Daedalea quercina L-15889 TaxID=1314783 RepID=A0A165RK59_9APHY|nr:hypothetical protein DAEQUDRAFT_756189 [Daedalea quercina L-15889]
MGAIVTEFSVRESPAENTTHDEASEPSRYGTPEASQTLLTTLHDNQGGRWPYISYTTATAYPRRSRTSCYQAILGLTCRLVTPPAAVFPVRGPTKAVGTARTPHIIAARAWEQGPCQQPVDGIDWQAPATRFESSTEFERSEGPHYGQLYEETTHANSSAV